jgi:hypothetical protein
MPVVGVFRLQCGGQQLQQHCAVSAAEQSTSGTLDATRSAKLHGGAVALGSKPSFGGVNRCAVGGDNAVDLLLTSHQLEEQMLAEAGRSAPHTRSLHGAPTTVFCAAAVLMSCCAVCSAGSGGWQFHGTFQSAVPAHVAHNQQAAPGEAWL